MSSLLGRAIAIASEAHNGQLDKAGKAYITHPLRVMARLDTEDDELKAIAVLHDVVEDNEDWSTVRLGAEGMTQRVCLGVHALTRTADETYEEYIDRVALNSDARRVKIEDLTDNMDVRRLAELTEKDIKRLQKYHRAYVKLMAM